MVKRRLGSLDDSVSDEALLSGMALGDDQVGLIFVRRYQRRLFGLAVGIVGDSGDAQDVAQEAFIRIFRHAQVFDARRGSVSTWALTITRNLAIDATRIRRGPVHRLRMGGHSYEHAGEGNSLRGLPAIQRPHERQRNAECAEGTRDLRGFQSVDRVRPRFRTVL
jgi:RNA polymerase sigma factor (sigma-70 family)